MEKKYPIESDARPTPPSFDEMVGLIKKLFTDYLEDVLKSKPSEIEKSWERYKCLNHLYQDQAPTPQGIVSDDAHEKEAMMKGFDGVRKAFESRKWIMEGRGSYPYNDDRYKEEVRYLYDEVEAIIKETWADVKSKSFEYRQQIIQQYIKENPQIIKE